MGKTVCCYFPLIKNTNLHDESNSPIAKIICYMKQLEQQKDAVPGIYKEKDCSLQQQNITIVPLSILTFTVKDDSWKNVGEYDQISISLTVLECVR